MLPPMTHSSSLKNFLKSKTPSSLLLVLLHLNRKQYVTTCVHQASHHSRTNLSHGLTWVCLFLNTPLKDCSPWLSPAFSHLASLTRRYAARERLSFMNGQDTSCIIETLDLRHTPTFTSSHSTSFSITAPCNVENSFSCETLVITT